MIINDDISKFVDDEYNNDGSGGSYYAGGSGGTVLIRGCTDPTAFNYNPSANTEDGSCEYRPSNPVGLPPAPVSGCTDSAALNYDPSAVRDDGSCKYTRQVVRGCMDSTAQNYNPSATEDDGSCILFIGLPPIDESKTVGCKDPSALNYNPQAFISDDRLCDYRIEQTRAGCTNPRAKNYDPSAIADDGSCQFYPADDDNDSHIYGCTNATATNYNPQANKDDGSCIYPIPGCTISSAINYNPYATIDNGSCVFDTTVYGCTEPSALNYNRLATIDDGSCRFFEHIPGCKNPEASNYNPSATVHDGSLCVYPPPPLPPAQEPPSVGAVNLRSTFEVIDNLPIQVTFNVVDPSPAGQITIEVEPIQIDISSIILGLINSYVTDAYITFIDPLRFYKLLLNFGDDSQNVIANYRLNPINSNELQLKLISPIPDEYGNNSPVFLSREVAKTFIDDVRVALAAPKDKTPYLRPLNTKVKAPGNYKEIAEATLETLQLQTGATGKLENAGSYEDDIFRKWYSYDWNSAELNQDFSDYNNFVFYGSAELRLKAFREKLRQLELEQSKVVQTAYQLTTGSAYTGSNSQLAGPISLGAVNSDVTVVSGSLATYASLATASLGAALNIEKIIRSFDRYEQYLFYSDGSTPYSASADYAIDGYEYFANGAWPKNQANQLYSYTSSVATAWFTTQSLIAQRFDEFNQNSLMYTIPNHIFYDDDSAAFTTFVLAVGHFFDNLKPYIDQMTTNVYDRNFNPEEGMSIDLIWEIAETFGIKLPNPYSVYSLQEYILPSTVSSTKIRNVSAETWKRFLNSLIFLLKSRGTKTAINSFLRILGIHPQVISVKESELNTTSSFFITEEFSNGIEFDGSIASYIRLPLSSSLRDVKTIQLRYATNIQQNSTLANADTKFALNVATYPSDSRYGRLELVSGSNVVVSSSYMKMFDNEFIDVMLRRYPEYVDMTVIKNDGEEIIYSSSNASGILSSVVGLWTSSLDFYIGGSGSLKLASNFDGVIDEVRAWGELIEDDTFIQQTFDPGSYTGNTYTSSIDNLFVQLSFNREYNLSTRFLGNETPYFNLDGVSDPTDVVARTNIELINAEGFTSTSAYTRFNRKVRLDIPTIGGSTYTTSKVKVASPPVFSSRDVDSDGVPVLRRKSSIVSLNDKELKRGTNIVSITISPADFQNQNIARAFGGFNVNNLIGDPAEIAAPEYKKLKELQTIYGKYFYSKVDANRLIRIFETVLDGMGEFIDFLMPLKSKLQTGILIEPNILERVKVSNYKRISVDGSETRNSINSANTASLFVATDHIYSLEKTINTLETSYNPVFSFNESSSYQDYYINLTGSGLLPQFFNGRTTNPSSSAERAYITHETIVDVSEKVHMTSSIYSGGLDIPLFTTGAILDKTLSTPELRVDYNSPSEFAVDDGIFLRDLFTTGSVINTRQLFNTEVDYGTIVKRFVSSSGTGSKNLTNELINLATVGAALDQRFEYIVGGKDYYGNYNSIGRRTEAEAIETLGMHTLRNIERNSKTSGSNTYIRNYVQTENIIDTEITNIHKWGVAFEGNRLKFVTDGTGQVYPFAMGISLRNDSEGNPVDRTNIKYLYEISPVSDFTDLGVTTYFYKDDGLYRFPTRKYSVIGRNTYNFLSGNYETTRVLSGSFAEWTYGASYNENDVVVQNISSVYDISDPTVSTLKQLNSKVIDQIEAVRVAKEALAGADDITRSSLINLLRDQERLLDKYTEEYNKLRDDLRYSAAGNGYFFRFKRKTSLTSYASYIPPYADKQNWELLLYNPTIEQTAKRVLLDTDQLDIYSRVFSNLTITSPSKTGDVIGRTEFSLRRDLDIAGNQTIQGVFNLAKISELLALRMELSTNYRIRLYRTGEQRSADLSRPFGTEPTGDHGVLFDGVVENTVYNILSPSVRLVNGDAPSETAIYYSITNLDSIPKVFRIKMYLYVYEGEKRVPLGYLPRHYKFTRDNATATKRRNYLGCLQTKQTTTDGFEPIEVSISSGTDVTVSNTSPNDSITLGGGGTLNVT